MRKTLIALFAVPALAGFAFAASPPIFVTQAVSITVPMYLAMSTLVLPAVSFNFTDATDALATRFGLTPATLANYQIAVAGGADATCGPTNGTKTTLSVKTNSKKYTLTATLSTAPAAGGPAAVDFLVYAGAAPSDSTPYAPIGTGKQLTSTTSNGSWSTAADIYIGLIMRANATYNFDTSGTAIPYDAILTYTVTQP